MRQKAIRLYQTLWYEDGQDGRETLTCPGLIGASKATLTAASVCNAAKDQFKNAVLALKTLHKNQADTIIVVNTRFDEVLALFRWYHYDSPEGSTSILSHMDSPLNCIALAKVKTFEIL